MTRNDTLTNFTRYGWRTPGVYTDPTSYDGTKLRVVGSTDFAGGPPKPYGKSSTVEDPWKSAKRCVPALDFRYPDFFSESNPDSGRYLQIFGSYLGYDIHVYFQKKIATTSTNVLLTTRCIEVSECQGYGNPQGYLARVRRGRGKGMIFETPGIPLPLWRGIGVWVSDIFYEIFDFFGQ